MFSGEKILTFSSRCREDTATTVQSSQNRNYTKDFKFPMLFILIKMIEWIAFTKLDLKRLLVSWLSLIKLKSTNFTYNCNLTQLCLYARNVFTSRLSMTFANTRWTELSSVAVLNWLYWLYGYYMLKVIYLIIAVETKPESWFRK